MARVEHQQKGRAMEVYSTQPGVQFYTGIIRKSNLILYNVIFFQFILVAGNFLPSKKDESAKLSGKGGSSYHTHGGFCLETQNYPDAPNQDSFPDSILRPGEVYHHTTRHETHDNNFQMQITNNRDTFQVWIFHLGCLAVRERETHTQTDI